MKVTNMTSAKGNKIVNQFIIEHELKDTYYKVFQSYDSVIVENYQTDDGVNETYLDETYWNYSATTSKYRNIFLDETTKETQKKIDSGEYILTNLN